MEVARFFIDNIKKDIVVWAQDVNDQHGKATKLDNDYIKTKAKRSHQFTQTLLEEFDDLELYPSQYKVKNLDEYTTYRSNPLKYKKAEDNIDKLKCVPFQSE
eukprot:10931233-Ditylum_brightwellii.AAC.1